MDQHVALEDAHLSGGCDWSDQKKGEFASDPDNLNPTTASFDASKDDRTPDRLAGVAARVIDTDGERCEYATQHDAIKSKYDLTMTAGERALIAEWLALCADGEASSVRDDVKRFRDPDVPYLKWEVGPEVPEEEYLHLRAGILDMHRYASSLSLPPLPDDATFYLYQNLELAAEALARVEDRTLQDARRILDDVEWGGVAGLDPENEDSGWIMVNLRAYTGRAQPWQYMRVAAHELSHVHQSALQHHGRFDTTHQEVRGHRSSLDPGRVCRVPIRQSIGHGGRRPL